MSGEELTPEELEKRMDKLARQIEELIRRLAGRRKWEAKMRTKTFATEMRETIESIRDKQEVKSISCDNLIAYLDDVIKSPAGEVHPSTVARLLVEADKVPREYRIELFRSLIAAGQNALRNALLVNSGAVVALLAFLGKLTEWHTDKIPIFADSMLMFVVGVFLVTVAYGVNYLSAYYHAKFKRWATYTANFLNVVTILLVIGSYGCFNRGAFVAYYASINFG